MPSNHLATIIYLAFLIWAAVLTVCPARCSGAVIVLGMLWSRYKSARIAYSSTEVAFKAI